MLTLSDFYSDRGYAFVDVQPKTQLDPIGRKVNIAFTINPGREVLVNRINISGNTKTSDKVIRREMQVQEQEPYSASAIRDSKRRLDQLGFFSETRITTAPSPQPDKVDLNVNVTEQSTASFQVAGGFDSYQSLFGHFQLGNTNLFGGGEAVLLSAQVGFLFQNYTASYTEPWFLDIPLAVSLSVFDSKTDLFTFHQNSAGGAINSSYPLVELGLKNIGPLLAAGCARGSGLPVRERRHRWAIAVHHFPDRKVQGLYEGLRAGAEHPACDGRQSHRPAQRLDREPQCRTRRRRPRHRIPQGDAHARFFYTFIKQPDLRAMGFLARRHLRNRNLAVEGARRRASAIRTILPRRRRRTGRRAWLSTLFIGPTVLLLNQLGQPPQIENIGGSKELLLNGEITFPILTGLGIRGVIFADAGQAYRLSDNVTIDSLQAAYGIGIRGGRRSVRSRSMSRGRSIHVRRTEQRVRNSAVARPYSNGTKTSLNTASIAYAIQSAGPLPARTPVQPALP